MMNSRIAILLMMFAACQLGAQTLEPRIASETLPAGGVMQIKLDLTSPDPIIIGRFDMDSFSFDGFEGVSIFSPAGDAYGVALRQGQRFTANLVSPQGSLGTQLGYPFLVVAANIPAGLAAGTKLPLDFGAGTFFTAPNGIPYAMPAPKPGTLTIGGSLSVGNVVPGGGPLPAGFEVRLTGTGFDANTRVDVNEVLISNVRTISSTEIRFNLTQAADLSSKRIRVRNRDGEEVFYYSYLRTVVLGSSSRPLLAAAHPVFANATYTSAGLETSSQPANGFLGVALENGSQTSSTVTLERISAAGAVAGRSTVTLGAATKWVRSLEEIFNLSAAPGTAVRISATSPVHVLGLRGDDSAGTVTPFTPGAAPPSLDQITAAPASLTFGFQLGGPVPAAATVQVNSSGSGLNVSAAANAPWITVTPASGPTPQPLSIGVNPAGMPPGTYTGAVNLTAVGATPQSVPVTLLVTTPSNALQLSDAPSALQFTFTNGGPAPAPQSMQVTATQAATNVTVASSTPWITVIPTSGIAPFSPSISVNPVGLGVGTHNGTVTLSATGATPVAVPVTFTISQPSSQQWSVSPASLGFNFQVGGSAPPAQTLSVNSAPAGGAFTASSSANWITVSPSTGTAPATLNVAVATSGVSRSGIITIQPASGPAILVPVQLNVTTPAVSELRLTQSALELSYTPGGNLPSGIPVQVVAAGGPLAFQVTTTTSWIEILEDRNVTPSPLRLRFAVANLPVGQHTGSVTVTPAQGAAKVLSVTVNVTAPTAAPPTITSVVNSADQKGAAPFAPGQLVTIYGSGFGSRTSNGRISPDRAFDTSLDGVRVLFGTTPAPILFISPQQINVQIPFELSPSGEVSFVVESESRRSNARVLRLGPVAPALFSADSSGGGAGAILNEDYSVNSGQRPARRRSTIMIFANGGGAMDPPAATGVLSSGPSRTRANVSVWFGDIKVPASYAGTSPGSIAGLLQINVTVPESVASGGRVPVAIELDGIRSQDGVTMNIE